MIIETTMHEDNKSESYLLTEDREYAGQLIIKNPEIVKGIREEKTRIHLVLMNEEDYKKYKGMIK